MIGGCLTNASVGNRPATKKGARCYEPVYNVICMELSRGARLTLSVVSGAALAFAYPKFNVPALAWISVAPLMIAARGASLRFAALCGLLYGVAFYALSVSWVYTVMRQYGPLPVLEAAGVMALMVVVSALFKMFFAMGVSLWGRAGPGKAACVAPFLWVAMEFGLGHLPDIGFPWNLLGYAAARSIALAQITTITGIYGLSWIVAAYNALLFWVASSSGARRRRGAISAAAVTIILLLAVWIGPRWVPKAQPTRIAHLVQLDFPQAMSYPGDWMQVHGGEMDQLEQMSVSAARLEPGPIIWPETPAPFSVFDRNFALRAVRTARGASDDFIFGAVNWEPDVTGRMEPYNSAVQLDPAGREVFVYDKIHLVPFGEYVPWRSWLRFAGKVTADIGDFSRGKQRRVGQLPGGRYAVFICFESAFGGEVRQFTANGAELLINISNDGWFGRTAAPEQVLEIARVRAVENRRWLLRATNNGYTASVDPYGRIVAELPTDVRAELDAPYAFRSDRTFYVEHGEWVPWLCVFGCVFALLTVEWGFLSGWLHPPPHVPPEFEGERLTAVESHAAKSGDERSSRKRKK